MGRKYINADGKVGKKDASAAIFDYDRNNAIITIENISTQSQRKKILADAKKILEDRTGEASMANQAKKSPIILAKDGKIQIFLADGWLTEQQSKALQALLVKAMGENIHYAVNKNGKTVNKDKEAAPKPAPEPPAPEPEQEPQPEPVPAPEPEPQPAPEPPAPTPEPPAPEPQQDPQSEPPAPEPQQDPQPDPEPQDNRKYHEIPIDYEGIEAKMKAAAGLT